MKIQLSDHFTYGKLIRFVLPSVTMMIFTSIYSIVDGLFVSNFVGKTSFAAINLIFPLFIIIGAVGFMIGSGGSAIVAKTFGEGKSELANRYFSMLVYVAMIAGIVFAILGHIFLRNIAGFLGAEGEILEDCVLYGRILLCSFVFFLLQITFESFFIAAEKPKLGLLVTVSAGVTNIVLDALFIIGFGWGLAGAAIATAISQVIGGVIPLVYFFGKNSSLLRLGKTEFYGKILGKTCVNGSSEMMSNISASIVTVLYNWQLLRLAGEDGVAAYGVIMYVNFIFIAIMFGYSMGSAPIVSFHYGAGNHGELQNLFRKSLKIMGVTGISLVILSSVFTRPLASIFVGYDPELLEMTVHGYRIFLLSFLLCGFPIYGSAFFTALNNGLVSAVISFMRTLVFECLSVMILPIFFGLNGVWGSIIVAEFMSLLITVFFWLKLNKKYHYIR